MTREETKAIMAILKAGYPNFYRNMTKEDATNAIDLGDCRRTAASNHRSS